MNPQNDRFSLSGLLSLFYKNRMDIMISNIFDWRFLFVFPCAREVFSKINKEYKQGVPSGGGLLSGRLDDKIMGHRSNIMSKQGGARTAWSIWNSVSFYNKLLQTIWYLGLTWEQNAAHNLLQRAIILSSILRNNAFLMHIKFSQELRAPLNSLKSLWASLMRNP